MVVNYKEVDDFVDSINTVLSHNWNAHNLVKSDFDSIFDKVTAFCKENRLPLYLCFDLGSGKEDFLDEVIELAFSSLADAREWKRNFNKKTSSRWLVKVDNFGNFRVVR